MINARILQIRHNSKIGAIAKNKGWLTEEEVDKILIRQEDVEKKFGEIAVENGDLTEKQVDQLLEEQKIDYLYFGEALVKLGIITKDDLAAQLEIFNKLRLKDKK